MHAGGIVLIGFGAMQVRDSLRPKFGEAKPKEVATRNLLLIGLAFTGLNPFFIVWWLTAGANLILLAIEFASMAGVVFMYLCHVWIDYVWLIAVAHFAKVGMNIAGHKWYRAMMAVFGVILIYFGANFFIASFSPA
jgi:threonine/homoserine/homoserine lactone efflux protein